MAYKKQTDILTLSQKVKVLQKLFDFGCKTEKALHSLSMEDILQIDGISIQDMTVIMAIQKHVKAHTLFSYLGGGDSEQNSNGD